MAGIPKEFADAMKTSGLDEFFRDCTGPHQREYLKWIAEAKRLTSMDAEILTTDGHE